MANLFQTYRNILGTGVASLGRALPFAPELGLSERVTGGGRTKPIQEYIPSVGNPLAQSSPTGQGSVQGTTSQYSSPIGPVQQSTGGGAGGGGEGALRAGQAQAEGILAALEAEYNRLAGEEKAYTEGERGRVIGEVPGQFAPIRAGLQSREAELIQGLEGKRGSTEKQAQGALAQGRQLFQELEQRNIAAASAGGLSSSSVVEAMSERLGRETAQRIAGITGSRDEIFANIENEKSRVKTFTAQKMTEVDQEERRTIGDLQALFSERLLDIERRRVGGEGERAQMRAQLALDVSNRIASVRAQAAQLRDSVNGFDVNEVGKLTDVLNDISRATGTQYDPNQVEQIVGTQLLTPRGSSRNVGLEELLNQGGF